MSILISKKEDVPSLVKLINCPYRGDSSKKGWTTEADLLEGVRTNETALASLMDLPSGVIFKFCNQHNVIEGCMFLQKQENKMYLGMLTVSPLLQAKGIGKQLLKAAEVYSQSRRCNVIRLTVISMRMELISWYRRHGYLETGATFPFPADPSFGLPKQPLELLVMEKKI